MTDLKDLFGMAGITIDDCTGKSLSLNLFPQLRWEYNMDSVCIKSVLIHAEENKELADQILRGVNDMLHINAVYTATGLLLSDDENMKVSMERIYIGSSSVSWSIYKDSKITDDLVQTLLKREDVKHPARVEDILISQHSGEVTLIYNDLSSVVYPVSKMKNLIEDFNTLLDEDLIVDKSKVKSKDASKTNYDAAISFSTATIYYYSKLKK